MSTIQWGGGSVFTQAGLGTWAFRLSGLGTFFSYASFQFNFFFPPFSPHTTLFFLDNPFPSWDTVNWNLERKESVKGWVPFCCICFFCLGCCTDGLAQPENHKFSLNSACPSMHCVCPSMQWVWPRLMQISVALNLRHSVYSHLPLKSLVQDGNPEDLHSHCNLPWLRRLLVWLSGWNSMS